MSDSDRKRAEAERPLTEAGEGEAEGFEQTEEELIEHASHGDQHAAEHIFRDAPDIDEDERASDPAEANHEFSNEDSER